MSGFPQGLRPSDWMGDLTSKKFDHQRAKNILVTEFRYPGSHDCATYRDGLADFSYQCQDKDLHEQMMTGNRAFDLRLAMNDDHNKFIPVHGIAKNTADDFAQSPEEAKEKDLAKQIMRFAKEHPTEIIVLKVQVDGLDNGKKKKLWSDTVFEHLGSRLLESPKKGESPAKYSHAMEQHRNIIFANDPNNATIGDHKHELWKYVWAVGRNTDHWMGDGHPQLWNEPDWQSGDIKQVLKSTEDWMEDQKARCAKRDRFWLAFLQLTPVLGQSITTFFKDGGSIRPKDLALGGGIGTHGEFKGSNKALLELKVFERQIWKKHASCVMYDFADTHLTGAIVKMNLGGDD